METINLNKSLILILAIMTLLGCKKEKKVSLFEEVQKGNQLHLAKELSVSDFFQIWVRRGLPWKANVEITEVYTNKSDVYFYERLSSKRSAYLGNRKFEKGKEIIFKVNKTELENIFGFYEDLDPTGIKGVDLKKEFAKKVGLENQYDTTHLSDGIFEYELKEQGIQLMLIINEKKYESFYNAIDKKFE